MGSGTLDLFAGAIPASHLALPGTEKARQMTATSGQKLSALLKSSDPIGVFSRTLLYFQLVPSTPNTDVIESSLWPTPSSRDHKGGYIGGRIRHGKISRDTLDVAVQAVEALFPTPMTPSGNQSGTMREWGGSNSPFRKGEIEDLPSFVTGPLNPAWVEWLMGFPVGHTDLNNLETQ